MSAGCAKLSDEEFLVARLFTGPMGAKYNAAAFCLATGGGGGEGGRGAGGIHSWEHGWGPRERERVGKLNLGNGYHVSLQVLSVALNDTNFAELKVIWYCAVVCNYKYISPICTKINYFC